MKKKKNESAQDFADSLLTVKSRAEIVKWAKREIKEYEALIKIIEKQNKKSYGTTNKKVSKMSKDDFHSGH